MILNCECTSKIAFYSNRFFAILGLVNPQKRWVKTLCLLWLLTVSRSFSTDVGEWNRYRLENLFSIMPAPRPGDVL